MVKLISIHPVRVSLAKHERQDDKKKKKKEKKRQANTPIDTDRGPGGRRQRTSKADGFVGSVTCC